VFERFTDRARRVLILAQEEARSLNHGFIGTEHLLLGLIREQDGVAAQALSELGITLDGVRTKVVEVVGLPATPSAGSPPFTPRAKKALDLALRQALQLGHNYIGTEHVLLGVVEEGEGVGAQVLVSLGGDRSRVRRQVIRILSELQGVDIPTPEGSPPAPGGGAGAEVAVCSFCDRGSPEAGRLVSGTNASICEHCVRYWSGRLGEVGPPDTE
jgi:ATP-dependent Clp protease ATP-binding subunit ClpC